MRIGFISLGAMGAPMAALIQRSSRAPIVVHARRKDSAQEVLDLGAHWAPTPRELASRVDVVITMLPDLPELKEVTYGDEGLLAGLGGDLTVVACSTSSPRETRELGDDLTRDSGGRIQLVDAPVSGGVEGAKEGSLSIFLGGPPRAVAQASDALSPCGTPVHLGPLGAGQVAKAANQHIVAATTVALGEALVMAERAGLELATLVPLLGGGYAGSRLLEVKGQRFIDHDHSPASPAKFMIKDLDFALSSAQDTSTQTPVLEAASGVFHSMVEAGMGDLDSSGVQAFLSSDAPAKE